MRSANALTKRLKYRRYFGVPLAARSPAHKATGARQMTKRPATPRRPPSWPAGKLAELSDEELREWLLAARKRGFTAAEKRLSRKMQSGGSPIVLYNERVPPDPPEQ